MVKSVLLARKSDISELTLEIAAQYLLHELPILFHAPEVLNVSSCLWVYHVADNNLRELHQIVKSISPKQGFLIVETKDNINCTVDI